MRTGWRRPAGTVLVMFITVSCVPSGRDDAADVSATPPISVVSYNIRHGAGTDDVVDLERTAAALRRLNPAVIGLQEVDTRVDRSDGVAQADSLASLLGMRAAFGSFFDYQGGQYGMAILSGYPIVRVNPIRLPDGNEPRIALQVDLVLPPNDTISVFNVHFDWVSNDTLRYAQARVLADVLDTTPRPYILLGDFNDEPESRTLALFRARAQNASKPVTDHFTFSSTEPVKEIDFVFTAPSASWAVQAVEVIAEPVASDHRPVHVLLNRTGQLR